MAVTLYKQAIIELKISHGHNHPDIATVLNSLGEVYLNQDRYEEAEDHLSKALAIKEKAFDKNHTFVAEILYNLAKLYEKREMFKNAETFCERLLEIWEGVFYFVGKQFLTGLKPATPYRARVTAKNGRGGDNQDLPRTLLLKEQVMPLLQTLSHPLQVTQMTLSSLNGE